MLLDEKIYQYSDAYSYALPEYLISLERETGLTTVNPFMSCGLYRALPHSWTSPTMSPHCDDEKKYGVVEKLVSEISEAHHKGRLVNGEAIVSVNTVNGIRFTFADGSWGLVRASSNKPELVVVCESMRSESHLREIFVYIRKLLSAHPAVGSFNQTV